MTKEKNILESVIQGEHIIEDNLHILHEATDVPQFYLRGTMPGRKSDEASEDPNFDPIRDGTAPEAVAISDEDRVKIQDASLKRYQTDPHYHGIIDGYCSFIIGKGFKVSAEDENPDVQLFIDEFMKVNRFNGRDRQIIMKGLKAGEMFLRFSFTNGSGDNKIQAKIPVVRCLNYWEIKEVNRDPNDPERVISYVRVYKDTDGIIKEEVIPAEEIEHLKLGDFEEKRALPPFRVLLAWCQYYGDWLFNRVVLNRMKTSYYLDVEVDGPPSAVTGTAGQDTTQNKKSKTGRDILRLPKPGSKLIHNKAIKYNWLKPEVGADDAKEDGRAIRLAICAGGQAPEFLLGDASNANFASTLVSQNPFVRSIEMFQDMYGAFFKAVFAKVITHALKHGHLKRKSTETVKMEEKGIFRSVMRVINRLRGRYVPDFNTIQEKSVGTILRDQINTQDEMVTVKVIDTKTGVNIAWPTLIAQDVLKDTQALQIQKTMGFISTQTARERLGYDDAEEQRRIDAEEKADAEKNGGDEEDELGGEGLEDEVDKLKKDQKTRAGAGENDDEDDQGGDKSGGKGGDEGGDGE